MKWPRAQLAREAAGTSPAWLPSALVMLGKLFKCFSVWSFGVRIINELNYAKTLRINSTWHSSTQ